MQQEASTDCKDPAGAAGGFAEDEFGSDDFDAVDFAVSGEDHPDEVELNASKLSDDSTRRSGRSDQKMSPSRTRSGNSTEKSKVPPSAKVIEPQTPDSRLQCSRPLPPTFQQATNLTSPAPQRYDSHHSSLPYPLVEPLHEDSAERPQDGPPVGFFTARAAESIQAGATPTLKAPLFNPRLESPSIRKTAGVDHTKTKPVNRDLSEAGAASLRQATSRPNLRGNIVDPQSDRGRRIGMPAGTASPLQGRGLYKPPQMKRTGDVAALQDVTAASINACDKGDAKRQKAMGLISVQGEDGVLKI